MSLSPNGPLRVGVGGPVGTGKTALMDALCKHFRARYDIAAITNDIYTKEDAEFLTRAGSLPAERILGIETGGCPHTAIREDASINLAGVADLRTEAPVGILVSEVQGDRRGLEHQHAVIGDSRYLAMRMRIGGIERPAAIAPADTDMLKVIGNSQLLEQENEARRTGLRVVVERDH